MKAVCTSLGLLTICWSLRIKISTLLRNPYWLKASQAGTPVTWHQCGYLLLAWIELFNLSIFSYLIWDLGFITAPSSQDHYRLKWDNIIKATCLIHCIWLILFIMIKVYLESPYICMIYIKIYIIYIYLFIWIYIYIHIYTYIYIKIYISLFS